MIRLLSDCRQVYGIEIRKNLHHLAVGYRFVCGGRKGKGKGLYLTLKKKKKKPETISKIY